MPEPRGTTQKNIVSFNAGEWSPLTHDRPDLKKYDSACRELTNVTLLPYGGVERRAGFQYINGAKNNDKKCRLIGYNFSTTTSFIIEIGEQYMRFYSNGVQVTSGGDPDAVLTGTVPYLASEVFEIQFVQVNDIIYLTHPNHPVQKLSRIADNQWTIADVAFDDPPFLDVNITTTTITPSVTTGSGTLTALNGASPDKIFTSDHVGSYWKLTHPRDATETNIILNSVGTNNSSSLTVAGTWNLRTTGRWTGTVRLQEFNTATGVWDTIREYTSKDADRNVDVEDEQELEASFRIQAEITAVPSPPGATDPYAYLEVLDTQRSGIVQVTGIVSPDVNGESHQVTYNVIETLESTDATDLWSEGAWSAEQGYPRAVTIFEQRICYGGTNKRPQTAWGSKTGDFEDFTEGTNDDDAFSYTLASTEQNSIQWLSGQNKLLIGTIGAEWTLGGDAEKPVTPSNVAVFRQSTYGSEFIQAFMVADVVLYVQRNGRKVRELVESETSITAKYVSPDLSIFSEHITDGGITQTAFTQQPHNIFWATTAQGKLVGMTYEREQDVVGWFNVESSGASGEIESVATSYSGLNDEIWCVVKRTINGGTVRYIERFNPTVVYGYSSSGSVTSQLNDKEQSFYVDSGITYSGVATSTITGLSHLEGETVQILADGDVLVDQVVSGGQVSLTDGNSALTGELVHVGLAYESVIKPMKLEADARLGSYLGTELRIREILVSFYKSLGISWATNVDDDNDGVPEFTQFPFRDTSNLMDSSPPLFTGDKRIPVLARHSRDGDIIIKQTQPLPMTINKLILKLEVTGR
jgi:hypothetical protein